MLMLTMTRHLKRVNMYLRLSSVVLAFSLVAGCTATTANNLPVVKAEEGLLNVSACNIVQLDKMLREKVATDMPALAFVLEDKTTFDVYEDEIKVYWWNRNRRGGSPIFTIEKQNCTILKTEIGQ